jgi:hypothetical protein
MAEFQQETLELEVPRHTMTVGAELGRGQSGVVFSGKYLPKRAFTILPGGTSSCASAEVALIQAGNDRAVDVAIKMRLEHSASHPAFDPTAVLTEEALLLEALVLNGLKHRGIVKLLAMVTESAPVFLCTELMVNGDLRRWHFFEQS